MVQSWKAARAWNDHLCGMLRELEYKRSCSDEFLFYCSQRTIFLLASVDDSLMAGSEIGALRSEASQMADKVELQTDKSVDRWQGIRIVRSGNGRTISNFLLVDSIIQRFNTAKNKSTPTPITAETRIDIDKESRPTEAPYQELFRSFCTWLMQSNRTLLSQSGVSTGSVRTEGNALNGRKEGCQVVQGDS